MNWNDLWAAFALYLVLEGVLPFLNPGAAKRALLTMSQLDDRILRRIGLGSMIFVGTRTYQDSPPIPDFVSDSGEMLVPAAAITRGQIVFLKYGLMN